ncbi:A disintegrin and metalloproteinase with thrombospondin motifs 7 [Erinaceus europaeus]|uniref:A disintegrin and metalloproteinase with thrombospondin motifs 7 n=1 Tax=Erinaceus europaeus TaxID=9365 RepID=A0ABM3WG43_ERIEU|nr:A disintegrin and metalloproteinase with thrombospondin motifs 7 [Erinaceus europaeus]
MARAPRSPQALLLLLCALAPPALGPAPGPPGEAGDIVHPVRVDAGGSFLSYELWPRVLRRRALSSSRLAAQAFYEVLYRGRPLRFNLTANTHLLAPGFLCETRRGGLGRTLLRARVPACHLLGQVQDPQLDSGLAAISACDGLMGVFRLSEEDYFIQPLRRAQVHPGRARPHVVYKRQAPQRGAAPGDTQAAGTCDVQESPEVEARRERWQQLLPRPRRLHQRSVSKEKWVETLVVADTKMVDYHGQPDVESYVLTIMNMVAGLFHDPSIGNPIHITVVRLVLLEEEEEDLKVTHHADNTLRSFCRWQKSINTKSDAHPLHHDTAILLTRKDLCASMNQPCETLGLSHVAGMCQPHRSCSVNEDSGLPLAFTVAHELGHSFGVQHDGSGNDCEPVGKRPHIMSPQLLYDAAPLTWSRCSRQYITRFLDRGWGLCLDDPPAKNTVDFPSVPPGVLYDVGHQCRLQYGAHSAFCEDVDDVCHTLWCSVGTTCHSKLDAAVDGTRCGENKWCLNGECVPVGSPPMAVDGAWSGWSAWSVCSRSCGGGVQSSERQCTQPAPRYKGRFCVGERRRLRLCGLQPCPPGRPSFRQVQCSHFDGLLYNGQLHTWLPVVNDVSPCELHCRPSGERFAEKLRDAVVDGTPCYPGRPSRDLCINGICKSVGCDFQIESGAEEDRCGVCRGNGSTCHTVRATFWEAEGLGYVDVGLIPAGARDIRVQEVAEAANFLALRDPASDRYFLNGGWTIQWAGDYPAAGTTFTYARAGDWENLTAPGPTLEPLWIQLLFQETNPGVRYEYTVHREPGRGEGQLPRFSWRFGPWSRCPVTCGTGTQRQSPHCEEQQGGRVDERHCDPLDRPDDRQRKCSEEPCPARWWAGEWQTCSRSCGPGGVVHRPVLCIHGVGPEEQRALPASACLHLPRPPAEAPCSPRPPCPATWAVGNWSQCSVTCGAGSQHRDVLCANDTAAPCEEARRPPDVAACHRPACPRLLDASLGPEGSGSGAPSHELFNEVDFTPRRVPPRPPAPPTPRPTRLDNAIDEGALPSLPGTVFVDDFYYDYNFINFHEDLSHLPFSEPEPQLVDTGAQTPYTAGTGDGTPPTAGTGDRTPSTAGTGDGTPPTAGTGDGTAPMAETGDGTFPMAGTGDRTPPTAETGDGTAPTAGTGDGTPPTAETGDGTAPTAETGDRTPPTAETGDGTFPMAGTGDRILPTADVGAQRTPTTDMGDWMLPTAETGDRTFPTAGTGDGTPPTAGTGDWTFPMAGIGDGTLPAADLGDWTPPTAYSGAQEPPTAGTGDRTLPTADMGVQLPPTADLGDWMPSTAGTRARMPPLARTGEQTLPTKVIGDWTPPMAGTDQTPPMAGMGNWTPPTADMGDRTPPTADMADGTSPIGAPPLTKGLPEAEKEGPLAERTPVPGPSHALPPLSGWSPGNPLSNSLSEDSVSVGARGPGVPSSEGGVEPPAAPVPSSQFPGAKDGGGRLSPQQWGGTSEISQDKEISGHGEPSLSPSPSPAASQLSHGAMAASSPGLEEPWMWGPVAGSPGHHGLWLTVGSASPPPATWTPLLPSQGRAPQDLAVTPVGSGPGTWVPALAPGAPEQGRSQPPGPEQLATPEGSSPPSSRPPEAWPLSPSLAEEGPPGLQPPGSASWEVGAWSQCSATCGLGAMWRPVHCSSSREDDCPAARRPQPARHCHLRPCATWLAGNWSKCSRGCGGGSSVRDVQCVDTQALRPLRPFHCQPGPPQPATRRACGLQPCLSWYTSSWRECSEPCGRGQQQRLVTCPEPGLCEEALRPHSTQPCNTQPCARWVVGPWGQCSAPCGGGVQRRLVKCVSAQTGLPEEDGEQCGHETQPESLKPCATQDCRLSEPASCKRDRLPFGFCETLRLLGRCLLPTIRTQCCLTCGHPSDAG